MANISRPRRNLKSTLRLMAFPVVAREGPQRVAAAWLVVGRLLALVAALGSSAARLAGLLLVLALPEWLAALVLALPEWPVALVLALPEWPVALVLEASVAQVLPRVLQDVSEARLVVA